MQGFLYHNKELTSILHAIALKEAVEGSSMTQYTFSEDTIFLLLNHYL